MLVREIVSEVVNDLRSLSVDDRISERYVLSKLKYFNALFLKRENDQLRLAYYDNIWLTVECVKMIASNSTVCSDVAIPKVSTYMMSEKEIPEIYSYNNGPLIKEVMSLDEGYFYQHTTSLDYSKIIKREFQSPKKYFWIRNNHLIIPDSSAESIILTAAFLDPYKAKQLSECSPSCPNPMDDEFPCPAHLVETVRQEAVKDLFNFYKRNQPDVIPDLDPTKKSELQNRQ